MHFPWPVKSFSRYCIKNHRKEKIHQSAFRKLQAKQIEHKVQELLFMLSQKTDIFQIHHN